MFTCILHTAILLQYISINYNLYYDGLVSNMINEWKVYTNLLSQCHITSTIASTRLGNIAK